MEFEKERQVVAKKLKQALKRTKKNVIPQRSQSKLQKLVAKKSSKTSARETTKAKVRILGELLKDGGKISYAAVDREYKRRLKGKARAEDQIIVEEEPVLEAEKANTAMWGAIERYVVIPTERMRFNLPNFLGSGSKSLMKKCSEVLKTIPSIKVITTYDGYFNKNFYNDENEGGWNIPQEERKIFRSKVQIILNEGEIVNAIDIQRLEIENEINEFVSSGSGWVFKSNINMSINIYHYNPLVGNSYIDLPEGLKRKQAMINIKNEDDYCFAYCIAYADSPVEKNADRVSKYKDTAKRYIEEWKHTYPMRVQDISKFEAQFDKCINVYHYNHDKDGYHFMPLHVSSKACEVPEQCINLMLIKEEEKSHYVYIKSMSALLYANNKGNHTHICPSCFKSYRTVDDLKKHFSNGCFNFKEKVELPSEKDSKEYVQFNSCQKMLKKPFVIYADFESILEPIHYCANEKENTFKYQKHTACGYAYKRVSTLEKYDKPIKLFRGESEDDVGKHFIESLIKEADEILKIMKDVVPMNLTAAEEKAFQKATHCCICKESFSKKKVFVDDEDLEDVVFEEDENKKNQKVRDHDHLTGEFRGAAHNCCNIKYGWRHYKVPVIFHNLRGYDSHLIIKSFENFKIRSSCIPNNTEKFLSFTLGKLQFIDSCSFIMTSLDKLTSTLTGYSQNVGDKKILDNINKKFLHFNKHFNSLNDSKKLLMTQKGVYPYDYMNSFNRFAEKQLPAYEDFYSRLEKKNIDEEDYERAQKVWKEMKINNMGEYHDMYLMTDVLLLADVFENFRTMCLEYYRLDPTHYITLPGFAWDALLLMTGTKLDVVHDYDMYLMIERGIRGGISSIMHRHSKANNKYMDNYDQDLVSKYIMYLDANNLYGWSMIQHLPVGNYKFEEVDRFDSGFISYLSDESKVGYILDVDLEYPDELHKLHNDYPLAPENITVTEDMISPHSKKILGIIGSKHMKGNKLIPNLNNKKNYVVHYRNLKLYLSLGLKLTKVNKVISFDQKPWMKSYIDFNTNKRKVAKEDFEKDLFKLMNNAVFGKTMENVRNRIRFELVNDEKRLKKLINDPTFDNTIIINETLVGVSRNKETVILDKPVAIGFSILDLSKTLMYDFHYNTIKKRYGEKAKLLFTDTDSLCYEIQTDDLYKDMKADKDLYDFSDYPKNHPLYDDKNKKVIGKFKDESSSQIVTDFCGLRSKMYAYRVAGEEHKKAKGVKKSVVKKVIKYKDYYRALKGETKVDIQQVVNFNTIRSYNHQIYSIGISKIGLCAHDDKRFILNDGVSTNAYGFKGE